MTEDNTKKTYLILSASYGSGHVRAAEALVAHLTEAGHTATHRDLLSFVSPFQANLLRTPYNLLMRHFPRVYGMLYHLLKQTWALKLLQASYQPIIWARKKSIISYISKVNPDYIVSTHFTWGEILDSLTNQGVSIPPYYTVVTDYTYHPMWKNRFGAGYLLGAEDVQKRFISAGIPKQLLHVTGIPVSPIFAQHRTSTNDRVTILLGGYGLVFPKQQIAAITKQYPKTPIHIICGNNTRLVQKLQAKYSHIPHISVHGWISAVHEYICNSIVVVTKTGGMTTTECLVSGTPIDAIPPIPGQETENYLFLKTHNLLYGSTHKKNTETIPVFSISNTPFLF